MIIHPDSHLDHVPQPVLDFVLDRFKDKTGFFIETVTLPEPVTVTNLLYGPAAGDPPVTAATYANRPGRDWPSRTTNQPPRQTNVCTVVAGPYKEYDCVLYTVYGGPQAPREENDPNLPEHEREQAKTFWREHALARS